jgi:hypothetical protein
VSAAFLAETFEFNEALQIPEQEMLCISFLRPAPSLLNGESKDFLISL